MLTIAPSLADGDLHLVHLGVNLVSDDYVDWINDPEVVMYTESRFRKHTRHDIEQFVASVENDPTSIMWGLFIGPKHIGNIKLGPVDWHHAYSEIGIILGSKSHWGKSYGTKAISLVSNWALETLSLHKLIAGICDGNTGSVRAFEKAGFDVEARQSSHYYLDGEYKDRLILARFNPLPVLPPGQS